MITKTDWQIAPSSLACGVGDPSALRSRTLQPLTALPAGPRAAPPMAGANAHVAPSPPLPVRPFASLKTAMPLTRHGCTPAGAARCHLESSFHRSTSVANETCVPSTAARASGLSRFKSHSKKRILNLVGRRIQPPHNPQVRSRRQRYVHTRARLLGCYTPRAMPCRCRALLLRDAAAPLLIQHSTLRPPRIAPQPAAPQRRRPRRHPSSGNPPPHASVPAAHRVWAWPCLEVLRSAVAVLPCCQSTAAARRHGPILWPWL